MNTRSEFIAALWRVYERAAEEVSDSHANPHLSNLESFLRQMESELSRQINLEVDEYSQGTVSASEFLFRLALVDRL